jgi:hypothetical protein
MDFPGSIYIQKLINLIIKDHNTKTIVECLFLNTEIDTHDFFQLFVDNCGVHVILILINGISEEERTKLNDLILLYLDVLILNKNGVLVIKKFIDKSYDPAIKNKINDKICMNFIKISQDQFGSTIILHLLDNFNFHNGIINKFVEQKFIKLSVNKISCQIAEKFLINSNKIVVEKLFKKLKNSNKFQSLEKNKFGALILNKTFNKIK